MEGAEKLLLAVYTRFILRDFVGKVIPGGMCMFGVSVLMLGFHKTARIVHVLSAFELSILVAVAWISAIFIQSLGSAVRLFGYFPGDFKIATEEVNMFLRRATEDEKAQYERFVAIKEASGNASVALLLLLLLTCYSLGFDFYLHHQVPHYSPELKQNIVIGIVWVLAIVFLNIMHRQHIGRQYDYVRSVNTSQAAA